MPEAWLEGGKENMAIARKGAGTQRGMFKAIETWACLNSDVEKKKKIRGDRKSPVEDTREHTTKLRFLNLIFIA